MSRAHPSLAERLRGRAFTPGPGDVPALLDYWRDAVARSPASKHRKTTKLVVQALARADRPVARLLLGDLWQSGPAERALRVRVLSRIAMGRVIRARDRRLGRDVALKELIEAAPGTRERFIREARITARLQHPAIVPIYEAAAWPNGEPFYAMKLVSGVTLTQKICDATTQPKRMKVPISSNAICESS